MRSYSVHSNFEKVQASVRMDGSAALHWTVSEDTADDGDDAIIAARSVSSTSPADVLPRGIAFGVKGHIYIEGYSTAGACPGLFLDFARQDARSVISFGAAGGHDPIELHKRPLAFGLPSLCSPTGFDLDVLNFAEILEGEPRRRSSTFGSCMPGRGAPRVLIDLESGASVSPIEIKGDATNETDSVGCAGHDSTTTDALT